MASPPKYNWEAIETEYCGGLTPLAEICAKYSVSMDRLVAKAKSMRWVRVEVHPGVIHGMATVTSAKTGDAVFSYSEDELKHYAAMGAAMITNIHRRDAAHLRGLTAKLIDRLSHIVDGTVLGLGADGKELVCLGSRESPADLLEKLSRVTVRVVEIERVTYGLDNGMPKEEDPKEQSETMTELRGMIDKLESVAATKALMADASAVASAPADPRTPHTKEK